MRPPKCKICEHEHWTYEPHVFAAVVNRVVNRSKAAVRKVAVDPVVGRLEQSTEAGKPVGRQTAWQRQNKDRYNEKMREHMRKKRKKPLGVPYG